MNKPKCTPINAHVLKQLFEAVQMQNYDLNFNNREDFKELEIRISGFRFGISYKGAAITDKALLKYWGIDKYGIAGRRYTPNSIYLDVLSDFCGYKNWNQFQKQSGFKIVNNVLPYEQKKRISMKEYGMWILQKQGMSYILVINTSISPFKKQNSDLNFSILKISVVSQHLP